MVHGSLYGEQKVCICQSLQLFSLRYSSALRACRSGTNLLESLVQSRDTCSRRDSQGCQSSQTISRLGSQTARRWFDPRRAEGRAATASQDHRAVPYPSLRVAKKGEKGV